MQGDVPERGHKQTADFPKEFHQKMDLTGDACKVHYDLAHLLVAHEDGSRLRDGMVVPTGVEPVLPT